LQGLNQDPSARDRLVDAAVENVKHAISLLNVDSPLERAQFVAALIPTIKNVAFLEDFSQATVKAVADKTPTLLYRSVAGDIVALVALDLPNGFQMLHSGFGLIHDLSDDQVFEIALQNLADKLSSLKFIEAGPIRVIDFHCDYNASLLLVEAVWSSVAPDAENDVVVAVPARDALIFAKNSYNT
jgi:uncharacterized protein YtpQ (UPF0354 family)